MLGYTPAPEDLQLKEVYRDWVHSNDGNHLHGGIPDNRVWKGWWHDLTVMPSCRYEATSEKVWKRFVGDLNNKLHGVRERRWNSERFIVFQAVILQ